MGDACLCYGIRVKILIKRWGIVYVLLCLLTPGAAPGESYVLDVSYLHIDDYRKVALAAIGVCPLLVLSLGLGEMAHPATTVIRPQNLVRYSHILRSRIHSLVFAAEIPFTAPVTLFLQHLDNGLVI